MSLEPISLRAREIIAYIKETGTTGLSILLVGFFLGQSAGIIPDVSRQDHKDIVTAVDQLRQQEQTRTERDKATLETVKANSESVKNIARNICFLIPKLTQREQNECINGVR